MLTFIKWFLVILTVWIVLGVIANILDWAENVKEGMRLVAEKFYAFLNGAVAAITGFKNWINEKENSSISASIPVDEDSLEPLKDELMKPGFFSYLLLDSSFYNSDFLKVSYKYRTGNAEVDYTMVEAIFKNFLRQFHNYPAKQPIFVYAHMDKKNLVLFRALSEKGRKEMEIQRNNRKSREIPPEDDLVE